MLLGTQEIGYYVLGKIGYRVSLGQERRSSTHVRWLQGLINAGTERTLNVRLFYLNAGETEQVSAARPAAVAMTRGMVMPRMVLTWVGASLSDAPSRRQVLAT